MTMVVRFPIERRIAKMQADMERQFAEDLLRASTPLESERVFVPSSFFDLPSLAPRAPAPAPAREDYSALMDGFLGPRSETEKLAYFREIGGMSD